jgi:hypothetical protein
MFKLFKGAVVKIENNLHVVFFTVNSAVFLQVARVGQGLFTGGATQTALVPKLIKNAEEKPKNRGN